MVDLSSQQQAVIDLLMSHYHFFIGICGACIAALVYSVLPNKSRISRMTNKRRWTICSLATISFTSLSWTIFMLLWNHQTLINRVRNGEYSLNNLYGDTFYFIATGIGLLTFLVLYWSLQEDENG